MAVYAIGDLQGCFAPLEELLRTIAFDSHRDRLWFVGDLVNRGPDSLHCLRFIRSLGDSAVSVLGNHDLHLICVAAGTEKSKRRDTLDEVLQAPDRDSLVEWLRHRPLMHVENGFALVHAALLPEWTVGEARALAAEVEQALRGPDHRALLAQMYGDEPNRWSERLRARRFHGARLQGRAGRGERRMDRLVRRSRTPQPRSHRRLRPLVRARPAGARRSPRAR